MSENGEIYTAGKNFTLPPALTALTNSNSALPPLCHHRSSFGRPPSPSIDDVIYEQPLTQFPRQKNGVKNA